MNSRATAKSQEADFNAAFPGMADVRGTGGWGAHFRRPSGTAILLNRNPVVPLRFTTG